TLMASERSGRERPDLPELGDVGGGDLVQTAVAGRRVVLSRDDPHVVVVLESEEFVVGRRVHGTRQRQRHHDPSDPLHCVPPSARSSRLLSGRGDKKQNYPSFRTSSAE